ncbi:MAG: hypothetical protein Q8P15_03375 [Nanoarchaeota archaeon]|nr:hypothetical protein [Nanoarchaeota archaeon]
MEKVMDILETHQRIQEISRIQQSTDIERFQNERYQLARQNCHVRKNLSEINLDEIPKYLENINIKVSESKKIDSLCYGCTQVDKCYIMKNGEITSFKLSV